MNLREKEIMRWLTRVFRGRYGRQHRRGNSDTLSLSCPLRLRRPVNVHYSTAFLLLIAFTAVLSSYTARAISGPELTVEEMKAKLASTNVSGRPHLCVKIAERQMTETSKLYAAAEDEKAQATLADVVAFSEQARDYAIQSHKYQKQTEIAVREMTRKLTEILHTLSRDDQAPVKDAVIRMQRVRDDLLLAMFPKGQK